MPSMPIWLLSSAGWVTDTRRSAAVSTARRPSSAPWEAGTLVIVGAGSVAVVGTSSWRPPVVGAVAVTVDARAVWVRRCVYGTSWTASRSTRAGVPAVVATALSSRAPADRPPPAVGRRRVGATRRAAAVAVEHPGERRPGRGVDRVGHDQVGAVDEQRSAAELGALIGGDDGGGVGHVAVDRGRDRGLALGGGLDPVGRRTTPNDASR